MSKRLDGGLIIDLFAGGGGASAGIEAALKRKVDIAINHDPVALAAHKKNHPETTHLEANLWEVRPREAVAGRPVFLLWASPDCKDFSVAKGGKPREQGIRSLAWVVVEWARETQPQVIFLENVREFEGWGPLDEHGKRIKGREGETFNEFITELRGLGYSVAWQVLDASQYGAPTRRKRLFLVARRDGFPIMWPGATHGEGLAPLHTAAECIDWDLSCPSIFPCSCETPTRARLGSTTHCSFCGGRLKPLAEKTLWRIAQGIRRFVLESADPFIVEMNHSNGPRAVDEPLGAVTTQGNRFNLVTPFVAKVNHGKREARGESLEAPLSTVTAKQRGHALVAPVMATIDQQGSKNATSSAVAPLPTTVVKNRHAVIAPILAGCGGRAGQSHATAGDAPVGTITTKNDRGLVAPIMVQTSYGERKGQRPRYLDLHEPLGTVVAQGQKHALVAAFINKHYGGVVGQPMQLPLGTVTTVDHNSVTAAALVKFRGTDPSQPGAQDVREPLPTISAGGIHAAEVRAFLVTYYGQGVGQSVKTPLRTVTTKDRLGLVTVRGIEYVIIDIGFRMLEPHELLKAQFGRFAATYDLSAATTKKDQIRLIGNSVCPECAEAVVLANVPDGMRRAA